MINGKHYINGYKPVNVYRNGLKLAGWENVTKTGETVEFDGTYDDFVNISKINGKTVQTGTPTPTAPISILGVGDYDSGYWFYPLLINGVVVFTFQLNSPLDDGDYIDFANQWVYRDKNMKIFGALDTWVCTIDTNDSTNLTTFFYSSGRIYPLAQTSSLNSFCSHFLVGNTSTNQTIVAYCVYANSIERLRINKSTIGIINTDTALQRVAKLKTWIGNESTAGRPMTLVYPLATPTHEYPTFPSNISSYYPTTIISSGSTINPTIEATAKQMII